MCNRRKKTEALYQVSFGTATCLAALLTVATSGLGSQGAGFPSRGPDADIRRAFVTPPPGYGEVPFWWWTGERLDKERLLWQLEQLHKAGIPGTQINYAHTRSDGWKTETVEPPIFSEAWWDVFVFMAKESAKRGMGIGMSGYTLDWPGRDNLFRQLGITGDDLHARVLSAATRDVTGGRMPAGPGTDAVSATAFELKEGRIVPGTARSLDPQAAQWELPQGAWRIVTVTAALRPATLDPLNPESGQRVIKRFFDRFLARTPPEARSALNYFFQDELRLAGDKHLWSTEFAAQFKTRKGYDVRPKLAALFMDIGPETAKVRLDFNDVMVSLSEAYYFKPIFEWHNSRGMIYACDPASRGRDPMEFGDYMRAMRWYTAPGFDTPGSSADLIKNKVGSSIAHLYERPRVWVEGYHSLGWQASPTVLFDSSNRNFLYGTTLLNLHGLYYTTFGGWWEWAPPCYHFRMPYWRHMPVFFKYFERLSYLLSQGDHVADVAIIQPHEPLVVDPARGKAAQSCAYTLAADLIAQQIDFDFIDAESLARAEIVPPGESRTRLRPDTHARLCVAGEAYRALVLPGMFAIRHASLEKALAFQQAGGRVIALGELPEATDRAGSDDPQTAALVKRLFAPDSGALHWTPPPAPQPAAAHAIRALIGT
ncbi:MAG TPA: glycosyl hydrolase, partial [Kiritimatiellia bacterium]|nr:glycosyl hydrolase [Kiritimatiellia bacterium]